MAKTVNYTPEQTEMMVARYTAAKTDEARKEAVQSIAESVGRSVASVRQKLVREEVYVKPAKVTKDGRAVESKAKIVAEIAEACGQEVEAFDSLEKATKAVLEALRESLS